MEATYEEFAKRQVVWVTGALHLTLRLSRVSIKASEDQVFSRSVLRGSLAAPNNQRKLEPSSYRSCCLLC
jgi:hypothetical protein